MSECIFCKIITGDIPAYTVYDDEHVMAFLDIMPAHEGHTLLIPKVCCSQLWDVPDDVYSHLMAVAKTLASKLNQAIDCKRVGLALEGFDVDHAHLHLIPLDQGLRATLESKPAEPVPAEELKRVQDAINSI